MRDCECKVEGQSTKKMARRARNRGLKFVALLLLMVFAAVGAPASRGQRAEKGNESIVRKKSVVPVTESAAEDIYVQHYEFERIGEG